MRRYFYPEQQRNKPPTSTLGLSSHGVKLETKMQRAQKLRPPTEKDHVSSNLISERRNTITNEDNTYTEYGILTPFSATICSINVVTPDDIEKRSKIHSSMRLVGSG